MANGNGEPRSDDGSGAMTTTEQGGLVGHQQAGTGMLEIAKAGATALAEMNIKARLTLALARPRNFDDVLTRMSKAMDRQRFAETARYELPMGSKLIDGKWVKQFARGWSIRFAEEALRNLRNLEVTQTIVQDDEITRTVEVRLFDLETNSGRSAQVTVLKTMERTKLREGQRSLGIRMNSDGKPVHLVEADDGTIRRQTAGEVSRVLRNLVVAMLPSWVADQLLDEYETTMAREEKSDPIAKRRRIIEGFADAGVSAEQVVAYLGKPLDSLTGRELVDLAGLLQAVKDRDTSWADVERMKATEIAAAAAAAGAGEKPDAKAVAAAEGVKSKIKTKADAIVATARAKKGGAAATEPAAAKAFDFATATEEERKAAGWKLDIQTGEWTPPASAEAKATEPAKPQREPGEDED